MHVKCAVVAIFVSLMALTSSAFAGKVELTTYLPSAYGEYINLKSTADSYFATGSGNVGIGTTSPQAKLQINGAMGLTGNSIFTTNDFVSSATGSSLYFDFGATSGNTYMRLSAYSAGGSAWNNLILQSAGGKVGIGTTSPVGVLDVQGSLASTGWTAVTFGTGWSNYAGGYQTVQYKKFGDFVYLRGLANTASAWATYPTITTLPAGYRPAVVQVFHTMGNSNQIVRVDINAAGAVYFAGGGAGSGWICLDGIAFSVD